MTAVCVVEPGVADPQQPSLVSTTAVSRKNVPASITGFASGSRGTGRRPVLELRPRADARNVKRCFDASSWSVASKTPHPARAASALPRGCRARGPDRPAGRSPRRTALPSRTRPGRAARSRRGRPRSGLSRQATWRPGPRASFEPRARRSTSTESCANPTRLSPTSKSAIPTASAERSCSAPGERRQPQEARLRTTVAKNGSAKIEVTALERDAARRAGDEEGDRRHEEDGPRTARCGRARKRATSPTSATARTTATAGSTRRVKSPATRDEVGEHVDGRAELRAARARDTRRRSGSRARGRRARAAAATSVTAATATSAGRSGAGSPALARDEEETRPTTRTKAPYGWVAMAASVARPHPDPWPAVAPLERAQQEQERECACEEEERVHARVDPVVDGHPARRRNRRRDERRAPVGQTRRERGDDRARSPRRRRRR